MQQFDVVSNANPGSKRHVPYLLLLQAPLSMKWPRESSLL